MRPQRPLIANGNSLTNPPGDCWRACIASLIERPCSEVPHFVVECGEQDFVHFTREWLSGIGFNIFEVSYPETWDLSDILKWVSEDNPSLPMILSGHPVGGVPEEGHAVIIQDGAIVYDPGNCGLDGPSKCRADAPGKDRWWVHVLCLSHDWTAAHYRKGIVE